MSNAFADPVKYPPVELTLDWLERWQAVPTQAFWAEEDEPMILFPESVGHTSLPYRVALQYGLTRVKEIPT